MSVLAPGFLVAAPPLGDPNFDRTVVYVLDHDDQGAVGVIVNRPTDDSLIDGLEHWEHYLSTPAVVFEGGPVEEDSYIALGTADGAREDVWGRITGRLGTVDLTAEPIDAGETSSKQPTYRGGSRALIFASNARSSASPVRASVIRLFPSG